ncbi:MAG: hypothetical protein NTW58_02590 [Actinobacteria bacterium]|nr:hypothetical protein [Actinomycetota bacterium]
MLRDSIFEAVLLFTLLTLAIGSITLTTGAATGSRSAGTVVGAGVAVAMYLLNTLAQISTAVHPYRPLSLFYYSGGTTPRGRGPRSAQRSRADPRAYTVRGALPGGRRRMADGQSRGASSHRCGRPTV